MNFNFVNLSDNLKCGMKEFGAFHNFNIDENGIKIEFVKTDKEELKIENSVEAWVYIFAGLIVSALLLLAIINMIKKKIYSRYY